MIRKSKISRNLSRLDKLYLKSSDILNGEFYSKLAILELCGWIEESMDEIVTKHLTRKIKNSDYQKIVKNEIKRTSGFSYEIHFTNMLKQVIGLFGIEELEKKADPVKFVKMCSALSNLKTDRDLQAHTHTLGVTRVLNAPSWTIGQFHLVYEGLRDLENALKKF